MDGNGSYLRCSKLIKIETYRNQFFLIIKTTKVS